MQKYETVPCKMHAFCQNAISFEMLQSGFVSSNIQVYVHKIAVCLYDNRAMFILQDRRNKKPDCNWASHMD